MKQAEGDEGLPELVAAVQEGDGQALETLIRHFRPRIFRFCLARLGDQQLAEDVTQETCVALVSALPTYEDRGHRLSSFVFGIAANKVAMERRSAARRPSTTGDDVLVERASTNPGPEDTVVLADQVRALAEPLAALSDRDREVLLLRVVAQLSADEVGQALGMSSGAVRVAQHRALKSVRARLEGGGRR
ncbi:putative RNA polymerase sigma-D factor [Nostocoides japonicum T1-X7]|uniref:Putative RNA polymerase sigma-D factor n=1 Tax=Nostocoides japonicum T1-X7 TaxID=1194083 RepID=A0A077LVP4_9MICO|nr:sigma-70 family RNA polymerase sigma factor [Tetrasphaera japonica]CCH76035.1 putative RNA polymerase sigma-D factor [Tetrasphaera japonica T1-X7]